MPGRARHRSADDSVSEFTTARLSVYLRCLEALEQSGIKTISSKALAERFDLNAAQIRKDLATFGDFGVRGVGYIVDDLRRHLRKILGLGRNLRVVIVGAGNLGMALADYPGFKEDGFEIVALLDVAANKVGHSTRGGMVIRHLHELADVVRDEQVRIAAVAVPASAAQKVVDEIVASGIRAILNFSPGALRVPGTVKVKHADLSVSLESLSFFLAQECDARKA